jgi:NAD(P)H-flavin reductase
MEITASFKSQSLTRIHETTKKNIWISGCYLRGFVASREKMFFMVDALAGLPYIVGIINSALAKEVRHERRMGKEACLQHPVPQM